MMCFLVKGTPYLQHSMGVSLGYVGGKVLQENGEIHVGAMDELVD